MLNHKVMLRVAGIEDAHVVASLVAANRAGTLSAVRAARPSGTEEIARAIAEERVRYQIVSSNDEPIGLTEWQWIGQRTARNATVGVVISDAEMWSRGHGAEAIDATLEIVFLTHDAHRVEFMTAETNFPMINMLARRGGPVLEGRLRDYYFAEGGYEDALVWSILRCEYDAARAEQRDHVEATSTRAGLIARSRQRLAMYAADQENTSIGQLSTMGYERS